MLQNRVPSLAFTVLILLGNVVHGETTDAQRKPVVYPLEVTVWEIDDTGVKTERVNQLLKMTKNDGAQKLHVWGHCRFITVFNEVIFSRYHLQPWCRVEDWDRNRVALTIDLEVLGKLRKPIGLSLGDYEILREFQHSKVLRPGQTLELDRPRGEFLQEYRDIGGRFVFRFRLRKPVIAAD